MQRLPQKRLMNKLMEQLPQHSHLEKEYGYNDTNDSPDVKRILTRSFSEHKTLVKRLRIENEVEIPDQNSPLSFKPFQISPPKIDPRTRVELKCKDGKQHLFSRYCHKHLYRNLVIIEDDKHQHSDIWDDGTILWPVNWSRSRPLRNHPSITKNIALLRLQLMHNRFIIGYQASYIFNSEIASFCPFCGQMNNTKHFFLACEVTSILWNILQNILAQIFDESINLTPDNIILNIYPTNIRIIPLKWLLCETFSANLLLTLKDEIFNFYNDPKIITDRHKIITRIISKWKKQTISNINQTILQSQSRYHSKRWIIPRLTNINLLTGDNWINDLKALRAVVESIQNPPPSPTPQETTTDVSHKGNENSSGAQGMDT
jgi:hypothetical protein